MIARSVRPTGSPLDVDRRALTIAEQIGAVEAAAYLRPNAPLTLPTPDEIAYAKTAGYYFDPIEATHDGMIQRLLDARAKLTARVVADAFVAGLGQKRPEWRSAIASFAVATHFPVHRADLSKQNWPCLICGMRLNGSDADEPQTFDRNWVLRMRFGIGGGSFNQPDPGFAAIDLEQFLSLPGLPTPTHADVEALRTLVDACRGVPPETTPTKLAKQLGKIAGTDQQMRQQTIETLAIIGVLEPASQTSYHKAFTTFIDIESSRPSGKNDWGFPAIAWRGRDGVNDRGVAFWFGHLMNAG